LLGLRGSADMDNFRWLSLPFGHKGGASKTDA
jgi:hypothetical protein